MLERFTKLVNGVKPLTVFTKHSMLHVGYGIEWASGSKLKDQLPSVTIKDI